jgi:LmbE family N-acetylglucosaminyl deacetylase
MHLFLSPHADDIPLSCGATVNQLVQQGIDCFVYTLCDGDPPDIPPDTPIVRQLHARWEAGAEPMHFRRTEDEAALAILGVKQVVHGLLMDCIYRTDSDGTPLYVATDSFSGIVHPNDPLIHQLEDLTLPYAGQLTHLHAPAAIGMHIDHQIVRDWALKLKAQMPHIELTFYEDYPYAEDTAAVESALQYLSTQTSKLSLRVTLASDDNIRVKLDSIRAYTSQLSSFWESKDEMDAAITRFMRLSGQRSGIDSLAERAWIVGKTRDEYRDNTANNS